MNLFTRITLIIFIYILSPFFAKGQVADFTADVTAGCAPLVVHFTNTSTGAASYHWHFGNSTPISYLTDASTTYLTPGTYICKLVAYNAAGTDSSVHTLSITVYPPPTVSFVASDTGVCPGSPVTFSSTGSPGVSGPVTYVWNFGDGDSSSAASPSHSYNTTGPKNITLSVTNDKGCVASLTISRYIDVYTPPSANFSASTLYICNPPGSTTFSNTSSGAAPMSCAWTFGGATPSTSSSSSPTEEYTATGSYDVSLIVTDGHGCKDTLSRTGYITVGGFSASFTGPSTGCIYSPITFHNTTTATITSATWLFSDGGSGSGSAPSHTFNATGTYTVTLAISNGYCTDTVSHTITILPEPVSTFSWSPTEPCPGAATISFSSSASTGSTVTWAYGDGGTGTGTGPSHTYVADGIYTVRMIVTNGSGCADTVTHRDTLYNIKVDISHLIDSSGCAPLPIHFSGYELTTIPTSGPYPYGISTYSWAFGDGTSSSSATPFHTYTAAGIYDVTFTIVTNNGCTITARKVIRVGTPPIITFTVNPTTLCADRTATFTATCSVGSASYLWEFGDGFVGTDSIRTHRYNIPDTFYSVTLIASYNGCSDTLTKHDYIKVDSPAARIFYSILCSPDTRVDFIDTSFGDDTHLWIFGDGTTSTADDPVHDYPSLSVYSVSLTTYNSTSGCRDTAHLGISLYKPRPDFSTPDTAVCKNAIVNITSFITGGTAVEYDWFLNGVDLGRDDIGGYDASPMDSILTDTFRVPGIYKVMLVIIDQNGCPDTVIKDHYMLVAKPAANFTIAPPSGCSPLNVLFTDISTDVAGTFFTNFKWLFGDGGSASVSTTTTSHDYMTAGTFNVREIVTDNVGCKDTVVVPNAVTAYKPLAAFFAVNTYPCENVPVSFSNISSAIVSSFWIFGDGATSSLNSPTHAYAATGAYTVKLVVTDVHGCTDTASFLNYINVTKPAASFYMTDSFSLCPPLSVDFINTTTGATSYFWYLGGGTTSILTSPSDLYTVVAYDTILLIATNSHGCVDTAIGHVTLFGNTGGFTYTPLSGCSPLTVYFNAGISNVPNIIWDFADGTTTAASYSDTISHTYTIPGSYVPKLILSDNTGCEKSSLGLDTIKIDKVVPGFKTLPNPVCINTTFSFKDTSTGYFDTIISRHWTFSTGDTSDLRAPVSSYSAAGTYPTTLFVTDGYGCTGTATENVNVYPPPVITVSPDTVVCVTDAASLTGYGGVSYTWSPAATVSCTTCTTTEATPTVVTQYTVVGTDIHGCINTDTVTVFLKTTTISKGWGDTAVCEGIPVPLNDTGGTRYKWIPSAGLSNAAISDPIATPASTTVYTVIARLADCIPDTNYVTVIVYPLPVVEAGNNQTLVAGTPAQLNATGTFIAKYSWSPDASLNCNTCSNPVSTASVTTTYIIDATSSYGCKATDSVTIHLYCDKGQIFIPNSFTPNGDGQNDVFYPRGTGISLIKSFRIYNRWGEQLFDRTNIGINDASNAWDGTFKGATPRSDVYVYIIDAVCETGEPINLKGDVTIIR